MFRWTRKNPPALMGAPAVRREKSYSAESGYVYHYFYTGRRPAERDREPGTEYVFEVSTDRKNVFPVSVFVSEAAIAYWQEAKQRGLNPTERYAIAKMALFQAFDERQKPDQMKEAVRVRLADAAAILETLGID